MHAGALQHGHRRRRRPPRAQLIPEMAAILDYAIDLAAGPGGQSE